MLIAILGALFVEFALAVKENAAAALYALPGIPMSLAITSALASVWVLAIHYGRRAVSRDKVQANDT